jgi:hypothetical protein
VEYQSGPEVEMAVVRTFEAEGWTPEQYDELIRRLSTRLRLAPGRTAPGVLFHWAAVIDGGMRAVDVYESSEAADRLVSQDIGPIAAELGLPLPTITELPVHAFLRS